MAAQRRITTDLFGVLVLDNGRQLSPGDTIPVGARVPRQYVVGGKQDTAASDDKADDKE